MMTFVAVFVLAIALWLLSDYLKGSPIDVQSSTEPGKVYEVRLKKLTCTCPDYKQRATMYEHGELGRICKHLQKALLEADAIRDPAQKAAIADPNSNRHGTCLTIDGAIALHNESRGWFNVYTPDSDGDIKRYGFQLAERRWARKEVPPNGEHIASVIVEAMEEG